MAHHIRINLAEGTLEEGRVKGTLEEGRVKPEIDSTLGEVRVKQEPRTPGEEAHEASAVLEREWQELREVIGAQADVIKELQEQLQNNASSPPTQKLTSVSLRTKPKDIPILELTDLEGLEAAGRLSLWCESVEQCSEVDAERVLVAKKRVSQDLALLLQNRQSKGKCNSWEGVKTLLRNEFAVDLNLDRAWSELHAATYDWEDSPQAFTNRLICRYAVLEQKFPIEELPPRDQLIKRKLVKPFPYEYKQNLESFLPSAIPLHKFLDRLEHQRQSLLDAQKVSVLHIPEKGKKPAPPPETKPPMSNQQFETLQQKLDNLSKKMAQMVKPPKIFQCPRCCTDDHTWSNCPPLTVPIAGATLTLCQPVQNDPQPGHALTVGDPIAGEASQVALGDLRPRRDSVRGPPHPLSRWLSTVRSFRPL